MTATRRPVLADVARTAGVSTMTVSRVLNDSPRVSDETRRRVEAAIDALGYRANPAARIMRGGRSGVLGVVAMEADQFGPAHALFGVEAAARASGHSVSFLTMARPDRAALEEALEQLSDAHADGVVVIAPFQPIVEAAAELAGSIPLVVVGGEARRDLLTAAVDQELGAELATAHLLELGHRTVHHVGGVAKSIDASGRVKGWRRALRSAGAGSGRLVRGDWSAAGGYAAGQRLLTEASVTAVFVANDQMALGVIRALTDAGLRVPEDVSVVGFDDAPEAAFYRPALTTIRQDLGETARAAVEMLLRRVTSGPFSQHVSVPPELIVRSSTARPSRAKRR